MSGREKDLGFLEAVKKDFARDLACVKAMKGIEDPAAFVRNAQEIMGTLGYIIDRMERMSVETLRGGTPLVEKGDVLALAEKLKRISSFHDESGETGLLKHVEVLEELLLEVSEELPVRWKRCDECDGSGRRSRYIGERPVSGGGPTHEPIEASSPCQECERGYIAIEWHQDGFEDALPVHPEDGE